MKSNKKGDFHFWEPPLLTIVLFVQSNKLKSIMESRNFNGQPIFAQIAKYLSKVKFRDYPAMLAGNAMSRS